MRKEVGEYKPHGKDSDGKGRERLRQARLDVVKWETARRGTWDINWPWSEAREKISNYERQGE